MNNLSRALKIFLSVILLGLQLITPLTVSAFSTSNDDYSYGDDDYLNFYDDVYHDDEVNDDENFDDGEFDNELVLDAADDDFDEVDSQLLMATQEYVPELLFADDTLLDVVETEFFNYLELFNVPAAHSGIAQFVLEPVQSTLPSGVTMNQARAAAMNSAQVYHHLYPTATSNNLSSGVNGRFGRDALFLGQSGDRFRVMIAGFVGYVPINGRTVRINTNLGNFDVQANVVVVPFGNYPNAAAGQVQSISHYVNRDGSLYRYLTNDVTTPSGFVRFLTGPAPSFMERNVRYYSFDGVYFYRNPRNIRPDGSGAVNANNPFFNYFQYLSFRSTSRVTAAQLNNFLTNQALHGVNTSNSVMINQGTHFINSQTRYGINALLQFSKAMLESAGGTSAIAMNNNNIFGLNAIDLAPGQNASTFPNVAASISEHANHWMSRGYLWTGSMMAPTANADWRYEGPHAGHKGSGMNVRYATDPYWGQKIAGWAFRVDRSLGNQDMNREQIAIRQNTNTVAVQNASGATLYNTNTRGGRYFPFLVTGTGSNNRLRILTDSAIVSGVPNQTALFNRNNAVGYIPNGSVWLTGAGNPAGSQTIVTPSTSRRRHGITIARAHLRRGPGTTHDTIRILSPYTEVFVTGRSANNRWSHVRIGNEVGWVYRGHLREQTVYARTHRRAHLRTGAGTQHSTIRILNANTDMIIVGHSLSGAWLRVRQGGDLGWVHYSHVENREVVANTFARGHLRRGPGSSTESLRILNPNTSVRILGHSGNGRWLRVRAGNDTGWIYAPHVREPGRTTAAVNLRRGDGTNYGIIRVLPNNTNVRVLRRSSNGAWTQVVAGNDTGWISSEFFRN